MKSQILTEEELSQLLSTSEIINLVIDSENRKGNIKDWYGRLSFLEAQITQMILKLAEYKIKNHDKTVQIETMQWKIDRFNDVVKMNVELIGFYEKHRRELSQANYENAQLRFKIGQMKLELHRQQQIINI